MSVQHIIRDAYRLLSGLEDGNVSVADCHTTADTLDPVLLHWVFRFLRDKYPATNPQSQGVLSRLLEISKTYPELVARAKEGEKDVISEWFDETYSTREFFSDPETMISHLVEKLEG